MQKKYQEGYAKAFSTLPASQEAQGVVETSALKDVLSAYNDASYVVLWLDTLYGANVGNALNVSVVNLLAGKGSVDDIVTAVNSAAAKE
jgi:multiple sugar transport system substrate-binding protein/raffinose/stachyose/melibiose transport system substrate-binding protein